MTAVKAHVLYISIIEDNEYFLNGVCCTTFKLVLPFSSSDYRRKSYGDRSCRKLA